MSKGNKWICRGIALLLFAVGVVLGVTWNKTGFCFGDRLFAACGLPSWSEGTTGTHYPAIVGTVLMLFGIGLFNLTLEQKTRRWIWTVVVVLLVLFNLLVNISF